jgi:hypothetical protein
VLARGRQRRLDLLKDSTIANQRSVPARPPIPVPPESRCQQPRKANSR